LQHNGALQGVRAQALAPYRAATPLFHRQCTGPCPRRRKVGAGAGRGRCRKARAHAKRVRTPAASAPRRQRTAGQGVSRRRLAGRRKLLQKQRGAAAGPRCARSAVRRPAGARRGSGPGLRDRHADDAVKHGTRTAARLTDMASTRKPANKLFVHDD